MKFGIVCQRQLPRPWSASHQSQLCQAALDQGELADRLDIGFAGEVEHHFLEEYSRRPPVVVDGRWGES